jgi:hypothetical protein
MECTEFQEDPMISFNNEGILCHVNEYTRVSSVIQST